jgi:hypothetical protein
MFEKLSFKVTKHKGFASIINSQNKRIKNDNQWAREQKSVCLWLALKGKVEHFRQ